MTFPPAAAGSGESVFVTETSAPVETVVVVVAESLPATGSSAEVTLAVFEMTVPSAVPEPTFTTNVNDAL